MFRFTSRSLVARGESVANFKRFQLYKDGSINGVIHMVAQGSGKLNLMDHEYCEGLQACTDFIDDMGAGARSVVFYAEKEAHFCAGLDLKKIGPELMGDASSSSKMKIAAAAALGTSAPSITEIGTPAMRNQKIMKMIRKWQDSISSLARCRVPIIACVDKSCIGGGFNVATACDFRFGTEASVWSLREAKVGITADIGALQRLPPIVGEGIARELAFTAKDIQGKEAQRIRLINECFPTFDECLEHSVRTAADIARVSPIAVQGTKHVMNHKKERDTQESLDYVRLWNSAFIKSDDLVEAGLAFAQKRSPKFTQHVLPKK